MRVIAGSAKGKVLRAVEGKLTRPTTDKVKEAIYNMISSSLYDGVVLDLFAGTGSLGIEALSRGMSHGIFVDKSKRSIDIIKENLENTGFIEQSEVYRNVAERALKALVKRKIVFDLVLLDPPYKEKIIEDIIAFLGENNMMKPGGIIVAEHDKDVRLSDEILQFQSIRKAIYGNIGISIYKARLI